jgi:WD40 repeat protein
MSLAIDNSTKLLYTGGQRDALIKVWNISTPTAITLVTTLSGGDWGHRNYVSCLAIGNGKLYSGSFDRTIIVWNLSDHTLIKTLREHESPVSALLYNRQQGLLYSSSCDNTIRIWDTNYGCGEEVCIIKNNGQNPWGLAMANSSTSGNGSDVSDLHKTIKVWNCHKDTLYHAEGRDTVHCKSSEDGQGSLISTFDRSAGSDPVPPALSICLSDGKLFSAGENNSVIVWKVE